VHGAAEATKAEHAAEVLFTEDVAGLDEQTLLDAIADAPSAEVAAAELHGMPIVDALVRAGLSPSKSAARKAIEQGGAYVNNRRVSDLDARITTEDLLHGRYVLVRRGKREQALLVSPS
jgi:tyrosyl-tRNA synthetase